MTIDEVIAALEKLARRRDIPRLLGTNEVRQNPGLAANPAYRTNFVGYYRMGRKRPEFYDHFFSMLQEAAAAETPPLLEQILQELYDLTNERHLSFGSKLRATVTDDAVIFDRNVARHFGVPHYPLRNPNYWLDRLLQRHQQVEQGIQAFVGQPNWSEMRRLFDEAFPNAAHLPDIRKADMIIWAHEDNLQ
jgi:hypothetical protein